MNRVFTAIILVCLPFVLPAQNRNKSLGAIATDKLTPGAALLFKNVKSSTTDAEKNKLYEGLHLKVATDKKSFVIDEYTVDTYIYPTDMNKDGQEELFVGLGSAALFGNVGESFMLYMKDNTGKYTQQPEISGGRPIILSTKNLGYPDILIGGPGFEFPVYRWNGTKYAMYKKMKDAALNSKNSTDLEAYSKAFTGSK